MRTERVNEGVLPVAGPDDLKTKLDKLFAEIPEDGTPIGNVTLLKKSGLKEDEYWQVRNQLLDLGKIGKGKGKGGSVYRLTEAVEPVPQKRGTKKKGIESQLYANFEKWLKDFWVKEANLTWFSVEKTAHQGSKATGGKWTRPDFAIVAVNTYRYFPGKFLEVISFEVKPALQDGLAGVFECAAHSVYANRSYLAIHVAEESETQSEEYSRIERECERFGLGLIIFSDSKDVESYEVTVDADRRIPDPAEVDKFIASQLKESTQELVLKNSK
jgi:hypothetical protein